MHPKYIYVGLVDGRPTYKIDWHWKVRRNAGIFEEMLYPKLEEKTINALHPKQHPKKGLYCPKCGFSIKGACKPFCPQCKERMRIWEDDVPRIPKEK